MFSMRKKNLKFHSKCGKLPNPFFHVNLAFISVGSVHRREIQKGENPRVLFELHLLLWPDSNQAYNNNTSYKQLFYWYYELRNGFCGHLAAKQILLPSRKLHAKKWKQAACADDKKERVIFAVIPVYAQQSKCLLSICLSIYPSASPLMVLHFFLLPSIFLAVIRFLLSPSVLNSHEMRNVLFGFTSGQQ